MLLYGSLSNSRRNGRDGHVRAKLYFNLGFLIRSDKIVSVTEQLL